MIKNCCPGDLVITSSSAFFVFDQINILDADRHDFKTSTFFMMNNHQQTAQTKVSLVISCPQFQHKTGELSVYVIFPEMIGWIHTWSVVENFGDLCDERIKSSGDGLLL